MNRSIHIRFYCPMPCTQRKKEPGFWLKRYVLLSQVILVVCNYPNFIRTTWCCSATLLLTIQGKANAGDKIVVKLAGQQATAKAADNGRWAVTLRPLKAGGPYTLTVAGQKQKLVYHGCIDWRSVALFGAVEYGVHGKANCYRKEYPAASR